MRRFVLNNVVLLIQYAVSALVSVLLVPHIVRAIGLAQFGKLALALSIASYGAQTVQYAFQLTGPRHLMQLPPGERAGDVVSRIASAKLALWGIVLGVAFVAAGLTRLTGSWLTPAQTVILFALPLAALLNAGWHLQAAGRFIEVSLVSVVGAMTALALGYSRIDGANPASLAIASVALVCGPMLAGIGTFVLSARMVAAEGFGRLRWHRPWGLLAEGWPLFSSQMVATLYSASGPIVVTAVAGAAEAGAYGVVERVVNALIGACLLTHTVAYPRLAALYSTDRRGYLRVLRLVVLAYLGMAVLASAFVIFEWDFVARFLFGREAAGHGPLIAVALAWLLLGSFGTALTGYLTVSGQGRRVLPLTFRILLISIALGIPGVYFFGAWAWLAALCAAQFVNVYEAWRAWRIESKIA